MPEGRQNGHRHGVDNRGDPERKKVTVKRITDCCRYYELDTERLSMTGAELGHLLGKSGEVAVVGVCDEGFAKAILNQKKG